jgi:hypothetical protein
MRLLIDYDQNGAGYDWPSENAPSGRLMQKIEKVVVSVDDQCKKHWWYMKKVLRILCNYAKKSILLGYEVPTAVVMKSSLFWDIMLCSPLKFLLNETYKNSVRTSQETLRLCHEDQDVNSVWRNSLCLFWEPYGTHKYTLCAIETNQLTLFGEKRMVHVVTTGI